MRAQSVSQQAPYYCPYDRCTGSDARQVTRWPERPIAALSARRARRHYQFLDRIRPEPADRAGSASSGARPEAVNNLSRLTGVAPPDFLAELSRVLAGVVDRLLRDKFTGQVADVFQDIDVLLIPVMNAPMPSAAEWNEMAKGDIARPLCYIGTVHFGRDAGSYDERRLRQAWRADRLSVGRKAFVGRSAASGWARVPVDHRLAHAPPGAG